MYVEFVLMNWAAENSLFSMYATNCNVAFDSISWSARYILMHIEDDSIKYNT